MTFAMSCYSESVYELSQGFEVPMMKAGGHLQVGPCGSIPARGASAVQVGTAASGSYGIFREIVEGIRGCIRRKGFRRVGEITGFAHRG